MSQVYHSNARTNQHVREIIQKSNLTIVEFGKFIVKYMRKNNNYFCKS